jgi:hypothetical protein
VCAHLAAQALFNSSSNGVAFSIDARDELILFLLIRINVGVKRLNDLIKRRIRTQRSPRRHLNSATHIALVSSRGFVRTTRRHLNSPIHISLVSSRGLVSVSSIEHQRQDVDGGDDATRP